MVGSYQNDICPSASYQSCITTSHRHIKMHSIFHITQISYKIILGCVILVKLSVLIVRKKSFHAFHLCSIFCPTLAPCNVRLSFLIKSCLNVSLPRLARSCQGRRQGPHSNCHRVAGQSECRIKQIDMLGNIEYGTEISSLHFSDEEEKGKCYLRWRSPSPSQVHERETKTNIETLHDIDLCRHNAN